jgi:hypothetical protein
VIGSGNASFVSSIGFCGLHFSALQNLETEIPWLGCWWSRFIRGIELLDVGLPRI